MTGNPDFYYDTIKENGTCAAFVVIIMNCANYINRFCDEM